MPSVSHYSGSQTKFFSGLFTFKILLLMTYTEKKTWYCRQASCSLFTNFFGKKVTTNFSLSKLQTKFIDNRLNR